MGAFYSVQTGAMDVAGTDSDWLGALPIGISLAALGVSFLTFAYNALARPSVIMHGHRHVRMVNGVEVLLGWSVDVYNVGRRSAPMSQVGVWNGKMILGTMGTVTFHNTKLSNPPVPGQVQPGTVSTFYLPGAMPVPDRERVVLRAEWIARRSFSDSERRRHRDVVVDDTTVWNS